MTDTELTEEKEANRLNIAEKKQLPSFMETEQTKK